MLTRLCSSGRLIALIMLISLLLISNYGTAGAGTPNHLGMALRTAPTDAKLSHVLYKGGSADTINLITGRIHTTRLSIAQLPLYLNACTVWALMIGLELAGPKWYATQGSRLRNSVGLPNARHPLEIIITY